MELEDLKKGWKEMDQKMDEVEREHLSMHEWMKKKKGSPSARQRLRRRFMMMAAVCFCMPGCMVNMTELSNVVGDWTIRAFIIFFLVMGIHKLLMVAKLSKMDNNRMTVREALASVYQLEKWQKYGIILGLAMAVPLLVFFFIQCYQTGNVYMISGAWTGLVIGSIAGWRIRNRVRREFREMREALKDELDGEVQ